MSGQCEDGRNELILDKSEFSVPNPWQVVISQNTLLEPVASQIKWGVLVLTEGTFIFFLVQYCPIPFGMIKLDEVNVHHVNHLYRFILSGVVPMLIAS